MSKFYWITIFFILVIAPFFYHYVLIPMYKECRVQGFSVLYCVNGNLVR